MCVEEVGLGEEADVGLRGLLRNEEHLLCDVRKKEDEVGLGRKRS